ncbi:nucleoside phosphorylase domain-containing protein [Xylariales sp. PMI_506]|nr:nucleoside phosphorylase domain-containing protein [Xylariales sp. PMI_506]
MAQKHLSVSDYTIGWICVTNEEMLAATGMLDEKYNRPSPAPKSGYGYTYGKIYKHNVVIAKQPSGWTGKMGANRAAMRISEDFPAIKIYLFVGIGGGMPSNPYDTNRKGEEKNIYLGDVVVASPTWSDVPAVMEHDRGRLTTDGFVPFRTTGNPITALVEAVDTVDISYKDGGTPFYAHLSLLSPASLRARGVNYDFEMFSYPGSKLDKLFKSDYRHISRNDFTCSQCSEEKIIRQDHGERLPAFHRGPIVSGDQIIQDGEERDKLSSRFYNAICFDMEALPATVQTNCLVIRGISDYADSHKSYVWQPYAAATAAAFARQLLKDMPPKEIQRIPYRALSVSTMSSLEYGGSATAVSDIKYEQDNPAALVQQPKHDIAQDSSRAIRPPTSTIFDPCVPVETSGFWQPPQGPISHAPPTPPDSNDPLPQQQTLPRTYQNIVEYV